MRLEMKDHLTRTFRDGLLPKAVTLLLSSCATTLLAGVVGDGRPVSTSSGTPPFSFSWELEGPIASLLGTGVMLLDAVFLKAGFFRGTLGFAIILTPLGSELEFQTPVDAFGVPLGAFEKKLRIDPFLDPEVEVCFFNDGGAGVALDLSAFTIMTLVI